MYYGEQGSGFAGQAGLMLLTGNYGIDSYGYGIILGMNELFDEFWQAYPNRKGKGAAIKKYEKVDADTHKAILLAIEAQKKYRVAAAKTGEWMADWCMPATWLHQQRHLDEIPSHSALKEKQDAKICCIEGCSDATMGPRFVTCDHHFQYSREGLLLPYLGLVPELRAHYLNTPRIKGLKGSDALKYIKLKIGEIGR